MIKDGRSANKARKIANPLNCGLNNLLDLQTFRKYDSLRICDLRTQSFCDLRAYNFRKSAKTYYFSLQI
jgi:hypothetical protein